jgi:hypothetical protein
MAEVRKAQLKVDFSKLSPAAVAAAGTAVAATGVPGDKGDNGFEYSAL